MMQTLAMAPSMNIDQATMDSLAAGGMLITLVLFAAIGLLFLVLGVLVPWFVWRTKVYTKRQYLVTLKMAEMMKLDLAARGAGGRRAAS